MKLLKKKNLKYLIGSTVLLGVAIAVPTVTLTSCAAANNPFGEYTVIKHTGANGQDFLFKFNTNSKNVDFYNKNYLGNDANGKPYYENTWVNVSILRNVYNEVSKRNVQAVIGDKNFNDLTDDQKNNRKAWAALHATAGVSDKQTENLEKTLYQNASFLLGIKPTQQQVDIANLINYIAFMSSVFLSASALANNFLNFLSTTTFASYINNQAGEPNAPWWSLAQNVVNSNNSDAKQIYMGKSFTVGEGANVYSLWPESFESSYTDPASKKLIAETGTGLYTNISEIKDGNINSPYPIYTPNAQNKDDPVSSSAQSSITVTGIKVNYRWYKQNRNGGTFVNFEEVYNNSTDKQKEMFKKLGINTAAEGSNIIQIPVADLDFNVIPESYVYTDPNYNMVANYIRTGLYTITPKVIKKQHSDWQKVIDNPEKTYPTQYQVNNVDWRLISGSLLKKQGNDWNTSAYNQSNIGSLAGTSYQTNLGNSPFLISNNEWEATGDKNVAFKNATFNEEEFLKINEAFLNIYYDANGDRITVNNINGVPLAIFLKIWQLGYFSEPQNSDMKVFDEEYKKLLGILQGLGDNFKIDNEKLANYKTSFDKGVNEFFKIVQIDKAAKSDASYNITDTGITPSK